MNQDYKNIELILVNDGSTDDSYKVCKQYAEKDNRIVLLSQMNLGAAVARNIGLNRATGDYVHICDADDVIEKDIYRECMRYAEKYNPDVIRFNLSIYHEDAFANNIIIDQPYGVLLDREYIIEEVVPYAIGIKNNPSKKIDSHLSLVTKRELLNDNNIRYNEKHSKEEDHPFLVNILAFAQSIVFLEGTSYHYMKHSGSLISTYSPRFWNFCDNFRLYESLFGGYYNFNSPEKIRYNVEVMTEAIDYVFMHYRDCNVKSETIAILKSDEAKEWLGLLEPKTKYQAKLKKLVSKENYVKAYICCLNHYISLRSGNLLRKIRNTIK